MKKFLIISAFIIILLLLLIWFLFYSLEEKSKGEPIAGDVPNQVREFLSQEDIDEIEDLDFSVYFGLNPPNIEGRYLSDSTRVDYDRFGIFAVGKKLTDNYRTFSDQTDDLKITFESKAPKTGTHREGQQGYISGEDNCFTVYQELVTNRWGCVSTTAEIISGCLDDELNIENYEMALKMMKIKNKSICRLLKYFKVSSPMPEGNVRIISESDGLVERKN